MKQIKYYKEFHKIIDNRRLLTKKISIEWICRFSIEKQAQGIKDKLQKLTNKRFNNKMGENIILRIMPFTIPHGSQANMHKI